MKFERAEQLAKQADRRKLQEQVTSAIENVVAKVEISDQTTALRLKKLGEQNESQSKEIKELRDALEAEKKLNEQRQTEKQEEIKALKD